MSVWPIAPLAPATKTLMRFTPGCNRDPPRQDRSPCLSEFSRGSVVEEHHVLPDGLAADVQLVGGEVWVGVADRQTTQDRQFRRDGQLRANDLGIPGDRD